MLPLIRIIYVGTTSALENIEPACTNLNLELRVTTGNIGSNVINNTTQTAVIGALVTLQATIAEGDRHGEWTWYVSGQQNSTASDNSNTFYWTETGTFNVRATFKPQGTNCIITASVNVNVILPTVVSYSGQQQFPSDIYLSTYTQLCGNLPGVMFSIGCKDPFSTNVAQSGIVFTATLQIPDQTISDREDSKVKYVQLVNTYRIESLIGQPSPKCQVSPNWMLDTSDPYNSVQSFTNTSNSPLTIEDSDTPLHRVRDDVSGLTSNYVIIEEDFEMYLVYFTGQNASQPRFQRPLAKVYWIWGGRVTKDSNFGVGHRLVGSRSSPGFRPSIPVTAFRSYQGNVVDLPSLNCPDFNCDSDGSYQKECLSQGSNYQWNPVTCNCDYVDSD